MSKRSTPEVDVVDSDAVEAILDVETALKGSLINRTDAIRALLLGVIAEQNVLLEGPPGVAKTKLGALFASYVRVDAEDPFTFFKTQLMKGSVPEQLFGPLNVSKMRNDAVWEYNTKLMLPSAHLAILEEVYRAPEMLLSSMLTVLNEREFHNGHKVDKCPLITALGTTNFITGGEETEAFNDRWLIRVKIEELKSSEDRMRMLHLANLDAKNQPERAEISLTQIRALHEKRRAVKIDKSLMQLFEQLVGRMKKESNLSIKLTDRRIVQTLLLIRASAVMNKREEAVPDDIIAAEYGLTVKGNNADSNLFETAYQQVVGSYQALKEESAELEKLEGRAKQIVSNFDPRLKPEKMKLLQKYCKDMLEAMENRDSKFVSEANRSAYETIKSDVERVLREATEALG